MTTITDWKALLTAQLECLEALSEDDIGKPFYFSDSLDGPWDGPIKLSLVTPLHEDGQYPFEDSEGNSWRICTKTLPIESQTVTLIPWSGGDRPVDIGKVVVYQTRGRGPNAGVAGLLTWQHSDVSTDIIAYRPITIDIEEG